jgi:putative ABC transport system permease protein
VRNRVAPTEAVERIVTNPRRSGSVAGLVAATVAFLALVGVGGATALASARAVVSDVPLSDLTVVPGGEGSASGVLSQVSELDSVQSAVEVSLSPAELRASGSDSAGRDEPIPVTLVRADPGVESVVNQAEGLRTVGPGSVFLGRQLWLRGSMPVTLSGQAGSLDAQAQVREDGTAMAFLDPADFDAIAGATTSQVWVKFADDAEVSGAIAQVTGALAGQSVSYGGTAQRAMDLDGYFRLLIALAVSLFAVGLLITIVGVSNTLRVSVAERRQQIGLQRALGSFASTVRGALVTETVVLALCGALVGAVCGGAVALTGVYSFSQAFDGMRFAVGVPTGFLTVTLLAVILVSAAVALVAARRATRVPPMAAIASQ